MSMLLRIVVITLGLAAAGFIAGGVVGVVMMALLLAGDVVNVFVWDLVLLGEGGRFGARVGAVLGPIAAWLLMRHVPLWLAIGGTAAGTIAGAVLGLLIGGFEGSFIASLLGFGASAVFLRLRKPRGHRAIRAPDASGIARARQGV